MSKRAFHANFIIYQRIHTPQMLHLLCTELPDAPTNKIDLQDAMIRRLFTSASRDRSTTEILHRNHEDLDDPCSWRGISCVEGTARSLFSASAGLFIEPQWAPPTLQYIHLRNIRLTDMWHTKNLPRDLIYFYMIRCPTLSDESLETTRQSRLHHIDLQRLPLKVEEYIINEMYIRGPLILMSLPPPMRFLFIRTIGGYKLRMDVYVDASLLPEDLQAAFIMSFPENDVKIHYEGEVDQSKTILHTGSRSFSAILRDHSVNFHTQSTQASVAEYRWGMTHEHVGQ